MAKLLDRIEVTPGILHGKARIKGTRIAVYMILEMLAGDYSTNDILKEYPHLSREDVKACLEYAAITAREETYLIEAGL
jgi:uncharacterized protein (DUF433 family)